MHQGEEMPTGDMALIALGSNAASDAGDAKATVLAALQALGSVFGPIRVSHLYSTPAFPAGAGPDFVNAACVVHTPLDPEDVLAHLHQIEAGFGRNRTVRWGQRTLDLDLIGLGATIAPDLAGFTNWKDLPLEAQKTTAPDQLILPHPRLQDRSFVLVPLADVAPDWMHPVLKRTIAELRNTRPQDEIATVQRISS